LSLIRVGLGRQGRGAAIAGQGVEDFYAILDVLAAAICFEVVVP
jgi:hypothetical protein